MATIQGFNDAVLYSTGGTLTAGANALVYVYSQGSYVNGAQPPTAAAGQTITVRSIGTFAAGDWLKTGLSGTTRQIQAASGTTLTLEAGTALTLTDAQHLLNIGTASAGTASKATIYAVNDSLATAISQSKVTADANGNFQFFAGAGTYDLLIQSSAAVDLYIDAEVSLPLMSRESSGGVVYVTTATDDFAVGGSTTTAALFMDESVEKLWIGGQSNSFVSLDGGNNDASQAIITAASSAAT